MQLDSRNAINAIVKNLLPLDVSMEDSGYSAVMISVRMSYMEFISDCGQKEVDFQIRDLTLEQLKGTEVKLVEDRYFESDVIHNFLFVRTYSGYSCFYNPDNFVQTKKQSVWLFQSNHDSCWRDDAHHSARIRDNMIRTTLSNMMTYHNKKGIEQYTPNMIVSNFSSMDIERIHVAGYYIQSVNGESTRMGTPWEMNKVGNSITLTARPEEKE